MPEYIVYHRLIYIFFWFSDKSDDKIATKDEDAKIIPFEPNCGARDHPEYARGNNRWHDTDKDQAGWTTFCDAIQSSKSIQTLVVTDIGIGPVGPCVK